MCRGYGDTCYRREVVSLTCCCALRWVAFLCRHCPGTAFIHSYNIRSRVSLCVCIDWHSAVCLTVRKCDIHIWMKSCCRRPYPYPCNTEHSLSTHSRKQPVVRFYCRVRNTIIIDWQEYRNTEKSDPKLLSADRHNYISSPKYIFCPMWKSTPFS